MCPAVPGPRVNAWGWACPATRQTGLLGRTRPSTVIYTIYTMAAASQASAEPAPHAGGDAEGQKLDGCQTNEWKAKARVSTRVSTVRYSVVYI
jgi:hypothetical protein